MFETSVDARSFYETKEKHYKVKRQLICGSSNTFQVANFVPKVIEKICAQISSQIGTQAL